MKALRRLVNSHIEGHLPIGQKEFLKRFYDPLNIYQIYEFNDDNDSASIRISDPFISTRAPLTLYFETSTPAGNHFDKKMIDGLTGKKHTLAEAGIVKSFLQRWHWENSYNVKNSNSLGAKFYRKYQYFSDLSKTRLMSAAEIFIDVGSYTGLVSLKALTQGKTVFSVEGQTNITDIARKNIESNIDHLHNKPNYKIFNNLAIAKDQRISPVHLGNQALYADKSDVQNSILKESNQAGIGKPETLDSLMGKYVSGKRISICLEINGNETSALSGAEGILTSCLPGSTARFPVIYPAHNKKKLIDRMSEVKDICNKTGWVISSRPASGHGYFVVLSKD